MPVGGGFPFSGEMMGGWGCKVGRGEMGRSLGGETGLDVKK